MGETRIGIGPPTDPMKRIADLEDQLVKMQREREDEQSKSAAAQVEIQQLREENRTLKQQREEPDLPEACVSILLYLRNHRDKKSPDQIAKSLSLDADKVKVYLKTLFEHTEGSLVESYRTQSRRVNVSTIEVRSI